ncbi:MAG: DNA-3-methyladenine glycosylase [Acidimicrobiia bacterium]|nr:DNA-3-methyladenine glycosylase [Acidimicrobiia bacterium]
MPTPRGSKPGPRRDASGTRPTYVGRVRATNTSGPAVLPRSFYSRPTLKVAEDLLGKVLVHRTPDGVAAGMIVEAEAYIGEDDPACHAAPGPTRRNAPLYGPPGIAYVYLNYGIHHLVNAVTESEGDPAAVLIRALDPVEGLALMRRRRATDGRHIEEHDLCRGPGNLTRALGITLTDNLLDLTLRPGSGQASGRLTIEDRRLRRGSVAWGPRIGIRVGVDKRWRCWIAGHPSVSAPRASGTVKR